jgi:DNA-binding transcriptional ArsR family regulator
MVRVNFTPDDVARTRFGPAAAPVGETVLAMVQLRRAAAAPPGLASPGRWMREARLMFPATARPLLELVGPGFPWPDFLDAFTASDLREGLEQVRGTPRARLRADLTYAWRDRPGRPQTWVRNLADGDRESVELVVRALHDLHDAVVAPHWEVARIAFHADVANRMPVLATGGYEALFGTLHPGVRWQDGGLERTGDSAELELGGEGILLMPSAFWVGEPRFSLSRGQHRPNILFYAAQPNGQFAAEDGLAAAPDASDSLAALLGPTRAAVLRALGEPRGTASLARILGITPALAAEHAKVLSDAYLIETRSQGRTVRHSLTELGRALLGQLAATQNRDGRPGKAPDRVDEQRLSSAAIVRRLPGPDR